MRKIDTLPGAMAGVFPDRVSPMRIFCIALTITSIAAMSASSARSAELPRRYWGDWSNEQGAYAKIAPSVYERDTFRCQFDSIVEGPRLNLDTYKANMTCWLVDVPRPQKLQAVFGLRDINGKQVLIVASHSTRAPSIDVLNRESDPGTPGSK